MTTALRCLIVDDEPEVCSALKLAMEDAGWSVHTEGSAELGLGCMTTREFDVLVIDKNLPGMNGIQAVQEVRRTNDTIACVLITAYGTFESAMQTLEAGVDYYVEKPFDNIFTVVEAIDAAYTRRRARRLAVGSGAADHFCRAVSLLHQPAAPAVAPGEKIRALVVSPDARDRAWFMTHMGTAMSCIAVVDSLAAALGAVHTHNPELVVLDSTLTRDGQLALAADLVTQARARVPLAVFVLIKKDGLSLSGTLKLIELGFATVVSHPQLAESFLTKVEKALGRLVEH